MRVLLGNMNSSVLLLQHLAGLRVCVIIGVLFLTLSPFPLKFFLRASYLSGRILKEAATLQAFDTALRLSLES